MSEKEAPAFFRLFTEIGILEQLSRAILQARLPDGLNVSHFGVINHLVRLQDGQTPLELARAFQVAKTTMTHTLSGLEKARLIEVRPNPSDARSKCIWLTQKGIEFREQAIRSVIPDIEKLEAAFSEDRVKNLLPELQCLREIMDNQRDQL